jgi:LmbE family N-acetylglucosaminyl deacetylase
MHRAWIAAVFSLLAAAALLAMQAPAVVAPPELALTVGPSTRLLVLAPHPDDEALGAAGLIRRVLGAGGSVRVIMMTSGDAFPEGVEAATHVRRPTARDFRYYGSLRERETLAGMEALGVRRSQVEFLGFPDGALCYIATRERSGKAFESPFTRRVDPPVPEQVIHGSQYRGADIRRELEAILTAYAPTLVALPHPEDHHPEHCATNLYGQEALDALKARSPRTAPRVLRYVIHFAQWPSLDEDVDQPLLPPPNFPTGEGAWRTLTLTPAETAMKRRALRAYATQTLIIGRFLHAFMRPNELFLEGDIAKPPACWCDDTHYATEPRPDRRRPLEQRR